MSALILVVDDDPDVRAVVEITLRFAGFEVASAVDGLHGISESLRLQPDLILLDLMMPTTDGYEVVRRLRADSRVSHIPVIMLTARTQLEDKVAGLEAGADDYVTKPFDGDELVARVHASLRRTNETRTVSPLTGLPGNVRIEREIARRVAGGDPVALLYADLNSFKAYNDHYGFLRGDDAIRAFADVLRHVVQQIGDEDTFVGHIGGDDFVVVTDPDRGEEMAAAIAAEFDAVVPRLYEEEDRERGFIEIEDRQGDVHRYPPVSVAIGVVSNVKRTFGDHREMVEIATEMKSVAKRNEGSSYAVDRRTN